MATGLVFEISEIFLAILLSFMILVQAGGSGFSVSFVGYRSKRGFERFIYAMTVVVAILFVVNSLLALVF
ncbi:preprotein translocase subunit SecG [candidate division WWE3 bacterium]|nr:preprotein translocase subunit SecG [candidate division WWE3 bacterium]